MFKVRLPRYWPGATSCASAKTGVMPAWVMSPSKLTSAPDTGFEASVRWKLTVIGPTRAGFGPTSLSVTLTEDLAADLEQATINNTIPENIRRVGSAFASGL